MTVVMLATIAAILLVFIVSALLYLEKRQGQLNARLERRIAELSFSITEKLDDAQVGIVNAVTLNSTAFAFPVPLCGPSIDPHHARTLSFLLQVNRPRRILELGSGSSTVYISSLLGRLAVSPIAHIAVDHDKRFLDLTQELCRLNRCAETVQFYHCPLGNVEGHSNPWYLIPESVLDQGPFDLIIIDGPPAYEEHLARSREPALPKLIEFLAKDGILILDDTNRNGEQDVLASWRVAFPKLSFDRRTSGKGHTLVSRASMF